MDTYKINKANELYSRIQGAMWAREKNEEYHLYKACEKCQMYIEEWYNEIHNLKLTSEEQQQVGFGHTDYDLADRVYYGLR